MPPPTEKFLCKLAGYSVKKEYVVIRSVRAEEQLSVFIPIDDVIDFSLATIGGKSSKMSIFVPGCEYTVEGEEGGPAETSPKALFDACTKAWISANRD